MSNLTPTINSIGDVKFSADQYRKNGVSEASALSLTVKDQHYPVTQKNANVNFKLRVENSTLYLFSNGSAEMNVGDLTLVGGSRTLSVNVKLKSLTDFTQPQGLPVNIKLVVKDNDPNYPTERTVGQSAAVKKQ